MATTAYAHDPVFSPGSHVLFKDGTEIHVEYHRSERGEETENEAALALKYGLSGDWVVGIEVPYRHLKESSTSDKEPSTPGKESSTSNMKGDESNSGIGDVALSTKYRFWQHDSLGEQESAAVLLKVKLNTASHDDNPPLGSGSTDVLAGISYGYESLKWYRWASLRYRRNDENDQGLRRGGRLFVDLAGGVRFTPPNYWQPDTVWLLELNGEISRRAEREGRSLSNSGGQEWFISPGVMWTLRNFAIKAGVQIPVAHDLNGQQDESDYRARIELEWHL